MVYSVERKPRLSKEWGLPVIGLRVSEEEAAKLLTLVNRVRARNANMDLTKILREMIGLDPMTYVTQDDLALLKTGKSAPPATSDDPENPQRRSGENPNPYEITKRLIEQGYDVDFKTVAEVLILDTPGASPQIRELILFEAGRLPKEGSESNERDIPSSEAKDS
jgi:hypothetical protein